MSKACEIRLVISFLGSLVLTLLENFGKHRTLPSVGLLLYQGSGLFECPPKLHLNRFIILLQYACQTLRPLILFCFTYKDSS
jgi:hypothetical protein